MKTTVIKKGAFTFKIGKAEKSRSTRRYLHVYEGNRRLTSYGCKVDSRTGKFESSLVLIENSPALEIIDMLACFSGIKYVKINPKGYVSSYAKLQGSWLLWSRDEN